MDGQRELVTGSSVLAGQEGIRMINISRGKGSWLQRVLTCGIPTAKPRRVLEPWAGTPCPAGTPPSWKGDMGSRLVVFSDLWGVKKWAGHPPRAGTARGKCHTSDQTISCCAQRRDGYSLSKTVTSSRAIMLRIDIVWWRSLLRSSAYVLEHSLAWLCPIAQYWFSPSNSSLW